MRLQLELVQPIGHLHTLLAATNQTERCTQIKNDQMISDRQKKAGRYDAIKRGKIISKLSDKAGTDLVEGLHKISHKNFDCDIKLEVTMLMHSFLAHIGYPSWESSYPNIDFYSTTTSSYDGQKTDPKRYTLAEVPLQIRREFLDVLEETFAEVKNNNDVQKTKSQLLNRITARWASQYVKVSR